MITKLIRGLSNITPKHQGAVATIGNFDGVHKGHQALIDRVKNESKILGSSSLVITFEPQPLEFFAPEKSVARLTRFREKFFQLCALDIDQVQVLRFNKSFAELSAEAFITKVLYDSLRVKKVIVGEDFRYGKDREGDITLLKRLGRELGFSVETSHSVLFQGKRVSSTWVRQALQNADHDLVFELLGRPYSMMGRVVYGDQRGRLLGFPTANIYLHRNASPVLGIYAVRIHGLKDEALTGVANVGIRPTVGGTRTLLEVHIFDFNENIYGKYVTVEFCKKFRDEERYANLDLLREQIEKDAIEAREYFRSEE